MRAVSDLPRPRREGLGPRGRVGLVVLAVALFILLTSLRGIAGFYTDLLWFDSLEYRSVFTGVLGAKFSLTLLFSAMFFVLLWLNLFIGDRLAPRFRPAGPEEEVIERYHDLIGHRTGLVRIAVSLVFALIAGAGVGGRWKDWILFRNGGDFGTDDAQFGTDVGFYVFKLPFLSFLVDWAFASMVIVLIVVAVAHYLNGGIRLQGAAQRVTPQVKAHLSVLLGVLALIKAAGYWLQRFELTFSTRGTVDGATATDVNVQVPAIWLLFWISLAAVILLIVNIWRRGWVLPALAVGLWAFVAIVVGTIYPAIYQRVRVEPAESSREAPYIARNIEATRAAMGLAEVEDRDFATGGELSSSDLQDNAETVRNIRLWDPSQMQEAFQRLQARRSYYAINDVDIDRYEVDGELTQVEIGVRDLNSADVPQQSWEGRHLIYTHGHGVVMAAANAKDATGRPALILRDIPVKSGGGIDVEQPSIYIGEGLGSYVMTNTERSEVDFQDADGESTFTTYDGDDGVGIGSYLRRAAFALRFGDFNPLISGNIRSDSKILFQRDVTERVKTLAPFLSFDNDPYPVVVDGRIQYIVDAYTTTSRYPYAQRADRNGLSGGSGLDHTFNYVRNSVKVVVDAYNGTTTFYVVDESDPIIRAYRKAFPDLFADDADVPEEIRAHFRYPEDLFIVQTNMWGRYHLDDPDDFYNRSGAWAVAQDPDFNRSTTGTTVVGGVVQPARSTVERIEPQYLLTRLPGDEELGFQIFRPFVPVSENDDRTELTAFLVAKSDPGEYGKLSSFVLPSTSQVDGPAQAAANMDQDEDVSRTRSLLDQSGSSVSLGNLVIVPIEDSLLYVRPFYIESTTTRIPEIRKVVVSYNGRVAIEDTLQQALVDLFGDAPETQEETPVTDPDDPEAPAGEEGDGADVAELLEQAAEAFEAADEALREGDLATYAEQVEEGRRYVDQARRRSGSRPTTTTTTTEPPEA